MIEEKSWIQEIKIKNTQTGNLITLLYNEYTNISYVFPHSSLFESIDETKNDIIKSIEKWEQER